MSESIFSNEQVRVDNLPHVEDVEWIPLNRKYLPVSLFGTWVFALVVPSLFLFVNWTNDIIKVPWLVWGIIGAWFVIFIFVSIVSLLGFKHKSYAVREHDIMYKSGLIFRTVTVLPFNRIQHSEINSGPIERRFDLSTLSVFTAGGAQSDLSIPGLLSNDAERMKEYLTEKTVKHGER